MKPTELSEIKRFLQVRRSHLAATLEGPAPSPEEVETLLEMASRVPDHGKLSPWRFIVYHGAVCAQIGEKLTGLLEARDGALGENTRQMELERFTRAPLVIGVVSAPVRGHKVPVWEQELAVGGVCLSLLNACFALGYAGQWLSEWYAFDDEAASLLGAREGERFAGFIHIGTASVTPKERPRPDVAQLTEYFSLPETASA